jgi:hypothetical protein
MNPELVFHLLTAENVDVVLVGGLAAVAHGVVHLTNDMDFCYDPAPSNLIRLAQALKSLHPRLRVGGLTDEQARLLPFQWDERVLRDTELLTLQTDAGSIDLMQSVPGVGSYSDVRAASVPLEMYGVYMHTLDLPGLIATKRKAARPKDLAALPHIEMVLRAREVEQERLQSSMSGDTLGPSGGGGGEQSLSTKED